LTISTSNRSGSLALIWNNDVKIDILTANTMIIDTYITACNSNDNWFAIGFYGSSYHHLKHTTCDAINALYLSRKQDSWLIFGDFNMILNNTEKLGGNGVDISITNLFNSTLRQCGLTDLGYTGYKYTWVNNQVNQHHIQERIDRFCANSLWISQFPRYLNKHLLRYSSDHAPILLEFLNAEDSRPTYCNQKIRRFENVWAEDDESFTVVNSTWGSTLGDCPDKLQATLNHLDSWERLKFGDIPKKVKITQETLTTLKNRIPNEEIIQQIKTEEKTLDDLLVKEELWWSQRAKVQWLKFGDLNTKYFHHKASQRRRKNHIHQISDPLGRVWRDSHHMHQIFIRYFRNIFTSKKPIISPNMLQVVRNRVDNESFNYLAAPFSEKEVTEATFQHKGNSAPGPDVMFALFYHKYWDIVGKDILSFSLNVLNHGHYPDHITLTNISLIPKLNHPSTPSDFRPISLCNVMMKIITKTLANRIKIILPKIVDEAQSAFLPGRLITDNSLLAFEAFHYIKQKRQSRNGYVGIKLDIAKAYDTLEWDFIEGTLTAMGFPPLMVSTIMNSIRSVSFSIMINGQPTEQFSPERGIRQGDPLSPYLFILCAEVLSGLITQSKNQGHLHGINIATDAPCITHLLYADDSLLFCKARPEEALTISNILTHYQNMSGQMVNLHKSDMVFSPNVTAETRALFQANLPINICNSIPKYLGLPTQFGRSKSQDFRYIMDRVWKKLRLEGEKPLF